MKPNFALDLSHDGIGLLHRAKGGWSLVGEVGLDDADLGAQLKMLRQNAADLESGGFSSKLVIPNSQLLFVTLTAPGPGEAEREEQIREGLEGLTPYSVDELVFDWRASQDGERVNVAVVARETLEEAEAFARDYRFNPVSFVGRSGNGFKGEPFFGPTRTAASLLDPGSEVEPDARSLPVTPHPLPVAESVETAAKPAPAPGPETEPEPAPRKPAPAPEPTFPEEDYDADAELEALLAEVPDPVGVTYSSPKPARKPASAKKPKVPEAAPQPVLAPFPPTPDDDDGEPLFEPLKPKVRRETAPLPEAGRDVTETTPAPVASPDEPPASEPIPAFTSRRTAAPPAALRTETPPADPARRRPVEGETRGAAHAAGQETGAARLGAASDLAPAAPRPAAAATAGQAPARPAFAPALTPSGDSRRRGFAEIARRGLKGIAGTALPAGRTAKAPVGVPDEAPPTPAARFARRPATSADVKAQPAAPGFTTARPRLPEAKPLPQPSARSEAEAMTVFGARRAREARGGPRYLGLILTLVLLLLMAAAAVWSTFFLPEEPTVLDDGEPAQVTAPTGVDIGQAPLPDEPDGERIAALPPVLPPTIPPVTPSPPPVAEVVPLPDTLPTTIVPGDVLSQEDAEAYYAVNGIWQKAPDPPPDPQGDRVDDLYVASIDPKITSSDAVALPPASAAAREPRPAAPLPPLPPGTEIALDERGLVTPTPEGTLTQDGILVHAGRPELVAPVRPGREVQDPAATEIPAIRPVPRPGNLIEETERTQLGGLTATELAAIRPKPRPQAPGAVVTPTTEDITAAVDAAIEEEDEEAAAAIVDATEQAVQVSALPTHRPSDFGEVVARARATADDSDGSSVVAAAATTIPQIPTTASVATQATVPGAINLRNLNLIGIYGSSNARRALVRMPNGRYVKVAVGDQLDGGKVISISESQLIYQKSGRNYTLDVLPLG
jgi:type IV pilus biogenesis protein PilP